MSQKTTALVVAKTPGTVKRVEEALDGVYSEVETLEPSDGQASLDCIVAVAPLAADDWATVEAAATQQPRPPVAVLTDDADVEAVRDRAAAVDVADVVVAEGDRRFETLANRVRGMVELRRSDTQHEQVASTTTHLRDLYEVATDGALSFTEKANRMLEIGLDRLDVENAHLSTIEREPEHYEIVASVGELPISPGDLMDLPTTFCRKTIETDDVLSFSHASEQGWADDPAYDQSNIECYLGSRIVVGGSLYGTVCFLDRAPHSSFSEAEQTFVSLVARWLSHELERTRRREALEMLHGGTTELMRATTNAGVCEVAVGIAGDIVAVPVARVWLVDEDRTTLEPAASLGVGQAPPASDRSESDAEQLWTALEEGTITQSAEEVDALTEGDTPATVRSRVVVPLGADGVIEVASETADAFDAIDLSLLKMLGKNTVAALERTERIEELTAAHERSRRIFESASDGLLLIDPDADEIVDCNDRAADLLGYDEPAGLLSVSPSVICREDAESFRALVEEVERNGRGWMEDLVCVRQDGKRIPTEVTASTFELAEHTGVLASLRDISERKRREQALDVFNRVLRHNIRNDMNVVLGHASMIESAVSDPDLQRSAAAIEQTGRKLTDLGEKARTFQKLDERDVDVEEVDLRAMVQRVCDSLLEDHPAASVRIEGLESAPAAVDSTVEVAFRELCENAIVHPATAEPNVSVKLSSVEDGRQLAVAISDEGDGLPSQDCAVLEGGSETPLNHGSGLGLWLANWVVATNGGTVSVVESGETGTTIRLEFPANDGASVEAHGQTEQG